MNLYKHYCNMYVKALSFRKKYHKRYYLIRNEIYFHELCNIIF